jgi:hypothetical protein
MTSQLNIIELIERNPITKLSNTYNVKLLTKIKSTFSEQEQQLFVSSFYCYLNYNKDEFVVDLDHVWVWLGFSQKMRAREVLERNFVIDIDYKNVEPATSGAKDTQSFAFSIEKAKPDNEKRGGHNYKKIMLTIKCFKSICLKSQTKKAHDIHEYYMKMEETLHEIIEEEAIEFKTKLEQKSLELEQKSLELKLVPEQEKHKLIMKQFGFINGSLIYILRVKQLDSNKYIIKIGESRKGVRNRYNEFRVKYGQHVIFLDAFPVNNSAGFEKFLHGHDKIRPHKVTTFEGHEKENELFMIGDGLQYKSLVETIELNINHYDYSVADFEKLRAENEKLLLENTMLKTNQPTLALDSVLKDLVEMNKVLVSKVTALENYNLQKEIKSEIQPAKITTILNELDPHVGPRLQKINPDHLEQIVQVYESATDAMKENHAIKRPSLNKAVRENTIYCGFRWLFVDRELDSSVIHNIQPTKQTRVQNLGYIAKLNEQKTEILNVYIDRKTAAQVNGYASSSSLDWSVKHNTISNGHYYQLFDSCEEDVKDKFNMRHGEFILYKDGAGQFDADNKLVQEFTSKYDCMTKLSICQKTFERAFNKELMYKGYYFRSMESRLFL